MWSSQKRSQAFLPEAQGPKCPRQKLSVHLKTRSKPSRASLSPYSIDQMCYNPGKIQRERKQTPSLDRKTVKEVAPIFNPYQHTVQGHRQKTLEWAPPSIGTRITASHLAIWKKSYGKPRQHIKQQRHHFADKGPDSQSYGFSSSHVWM